MKYIEVNKEKGLKDLFCIIKTLDKKSTRNGKPYLDMVLADATGEVPAKLWDYDEIKHRDLSPSMPVKVRGSEEEFKGAPQFRVSNIRPIVESDDFDVSELVASSPEDSQWMLNEIYTVLENFEDDDLKKILNRRVYKEVRLYTKPNNRPLVLPKVIYLNRYLMIIYLYFLLRRIDGQCIIFVPSRKHTYYLYQIFQVIGK